MAVSVQLETSLWNTTSSWESAWVNSVVDSVGESVLLYVFVDGVSEMARLLMIMLIMLNIADGTNVSH